LPHCAAARPETPPPGACTLALNVDTVGRRCDLFKIFGSEFEVDDGGVRP
jgi:hypothetical protein